MSKTPCRCRLRGAHHAEGCELHLPRDSGLRYVVDDPLVLTRAEAELQRREANLLQQAQALRSIYRATGNGLAIWRLYSMYRRAGLTVPEDVLRSLDALADRLENASGPKEIASALRMTSADGGAQGSRALSKATRRLCIERDVRIDRSLSAGRWSMADTYRRVAATRGTTPGAVKRIWTDHLKRSRDRASRSTSIPGLAGIVSIRRIRIR